MKNSRQHRIVSELDVQKRLQAETVGDPPSFYFGATGLDALIPAILPSSLRSAATGDRAFKGGLK
jgi:hypothetical protein